jgi:adenine-specific DNA-methyltransferase
MVHQEVALPVRGEIGQSSTSPQRPLRLQHQALLEGFRHLLPLLKQEATDSIGGPSSERLQTIVARRTTLTGVPDRLFDHSFLCKAEQLAERVVDEAVFTFLLCVVFCEALRQSYGLSLKQEALTLCIPEIGAYTWFVPSKSLQTRLNSLLTSCMLSPIPIYLAGEIYEGALNREEKKTLGQYYTPPAIADHLLDQVGYAPDTGTCEGPLLDVATGFGIFLAQATKRLVSALRAQNVGLEQICQTVERHIQGYDINPFAVIATKFHVLAALLDTLAPTTQQAGNVLKCYRLPGVRTADTLLQPLVDAKQAPRFVIGNPPYGPCGAGQHLTPYREVLDGRANLYQLFLYFALQRCATDGRVAFLMPESLRSGRYFTALRCYLATRLQLLATTDFQTRTTLFSEVEQGVLILAGKKAEKTSHRDHAPGVSVVQAADEKHLAQARAFLVPHSHFQQNATMDYMLPKAASAEEYQLLSRLCQRICDPCALTLGVHTGRFVWNQHRERLAALPEEANLPVLYAQSVQRFAFSFPPQKKAEGRRHLLYAVRAADVLPYTTSGHVLLLQRTTAREQRWRLITTAISQDFLAQYPLFLVENHVNYIDTATRAGTSVPLLYVLGLLNSKLINYLFAAFSGTTQVSAWELQHLPLLYCQQAQLEELVARRLATPVEEAFHLEQQIHRLVYEIYRISKREQSLIEQFYPSLSCVSARPDRE